MVSPPSPGLVLAASVWPLCKGHFTTKSRPRHRVARPRGYQNAPGGARSKPVNLRPSYIATDTRMLRGERDQNTITRATRLLVQIPECSGGSEIKTVKEQLPLLESGYQNAPGGARSKPTAQTLRPKQTDTRM